MPSSTNSRSNAPSIEQALGVENGVAWGQYAFATVARRREVTATLAIM
jgi:hypothetical protein